MRTSEGNEISKNWPWEIKKIIVGAGSKIKVNCLSALVTTGHGSKMGSLRLRSRCLNKFIYSNNAASTQPSFTSFKVLLSRQILSTKKKDLHERKKDHPKSPNSTPNSRISLSTSHFKRFGHVCVTAWVILSVGSSVGGFFALSVRLFVLLLGMKPCHSFSEELFFSWTNYGLDHVPLQGQD